MLHGGSYYESRLSAKRPPTHQTKTTDLGCESACRLLPFTPTLEHLLELLSLNADTSLTVPQAELTAG